MHLILNNSSIRGNLSVFTLDQRLSWLVQTLRAVSV